MSADKTVRNSVAVADPDIPANVIKPNADGSINTVGGGSGATASQVQGNSASGAADVGSPVKTGGVFNSTPIALTTGQRGDTQVAIDGSAIGVARLSATTMADGVSNNVGQAAGITAAGASSTVYLKVFPFVLNAAATPSWDRQRGNATGTISIPPVGWNYAAASGGINNTTTAVTVKGAGGGTVRNTVTSLSISTSILTAATELVIRDGAAGTVLWRTQLQTAALAPITIVFATPLTGTANTLLEIATLTASTGSVYVNLNGYTLPA